MSNEPANVEEEGGFWGSVGDGAMWVVDNGLYNTKEPWHSWENLFNISFLAGSVALGAVTAGGGTAALLAGRVAVGAAAKGAVRAGVTEVVVSAPVAAALTPVVAAAADALHANDEAADTVEDPETIEDPEIEAETPVLSLTQTFNSLVDTYDDYVPVGMAKIIAGISLLFQEISNGNMQAIPEGLSLMFGQSAAGNTLGAPVVGAPAVEPQTTQTLQPRQSALAIADGYVR